MIDSIRAELRSLIGAASDLDGHLTETTDLPDLITARALVELAHLSGKLEKVRDTLAKAATPAANGSGKKKS